MEATILIEVSNLTKRYGPHTAVDNLTFTVKEGEILGFLGPNGAGKTTTMNIMTGYISSSEGTVKINGYDILEKPEMAKKHIGYLPDVPPIYSDMTVMEYLNFVCDIKKVKKSEREKMIKEIIAIVKIDEVKDRLTKNLSKGYRQRVGLAQALVGFPEVIILDEPTNGLDPKQIIEMRDVIKELSAKHTVILSSHILSEVSAVCDRVMIISKGKIVASDTPDKLSASLSMGNKIAARIKGDKESIVSAVNSIEGADGFEINNSTEDSCWDIVLNSSEEFDVREKLFNVMAETKQPILSMKPIGLTLEEIFLKVTESESITMDNPVLTDEEKENLTFVIDEASDKTDNNNTKQEDNNSSEFDDLFQEEKEGKK